MKTIKKVNIIPVFVESIPDILEDNLVYINLEYNSSTHKCLCGCGNLNILPLNREDGSDLFKNHGWDLIVNSNTNKISFSPSILNPICRTHYVIQNNVANFIP